MDPDTLECTPTRIVPYPGLDFDIVALAQENSVLPCAYYRLFLGGLVSSLSPVANLR